MKAFFQKNWNKLHLQIIWYGREYCKARDCFGLLAKFVKAVTQIEKRNLLQKKLNMKILGIGNAIVDVICKVDDSFLNKIILLKSTMKLS